jgi:hypothetical protein
VNSVKIKKCPLCRSEKGEFHSYSLPNLYSEKIAKMTGISEDEIISMHANLSCLNCGLIYKKHWFSSEQLDELFKNEVPTHPKGWDVVSGRFSAENFYHEVSLFTKAIAENDQENINRYKRALSSIIDSIDAFSDTKEGQIILKAINSEQPKQIQNYKNLLQEKIKQPSAFKRFSGFSAPIMWDYINEKCGGIRDYSELGCPLWGLMPYAVEQNKPVTFYQRQEVNYWSENCKSKGLHCSEFIHKTHGIPLKSWSDKPQNKSHVIGFFQYLDHLEDPMKFMNEVFERFEVAAVILDAVDLPLAIQHFTGFNEKSLNYIANQFSKEIHADFEAIKPSGNDLYLFC